MELDPVLGLERKRPRLPHGDLEYPIANVDGLRSTQLGNALKMH